MRSSGIERDARGDGVARRSERDLAACDADLPGEAALGASEERREQRGASRAHRAADRDDLAGLHAERDVLDRVRADPILRLARRSVASIATPGSRTESSRTRARAAPRPRALERRGADALAADRAPHHHRDDLVGARRASRATVPTVLPSRSTVMRSQMVKISSMRCET